MKGLTAVHVDVIRPSPEVVRLGLTHEKLLVGVKSELELAGVRVQSVDEWGASPGRPSLVIVVRATSHAPDEVMGYYVRVSLRQKVLLARDILTGVRAATWSTESLGVCATEDGAVAISQAVYECVGSFAAALKEENAG
jgi:hypothetical protein